MSKQTPRHAHLRIEPARDDQTLASDPHTVVLVASNGEPLAASASWYSTRANARRAVKALVSAMTDVVDRYPAGVREVKS